MYQPRRKDPQITLQALTVLEPWCSALAYHGKDVENRKWRPPPAMLDQIVLLHAGKGLDEWRGFADADEGELDPHLEPLVLQARASKRPPLAGLPLATARLVGWYDVGAWAAVEGYEAQMRDAPGSQWRMPPLCQHVMAERTPFPAEWLRPDCAIRGALGYWQVNPDLSRRLLQFHQERNPR